jgi:hypothetical protein
LTGPIFQAWSWASGIRRSSRSSTRRRRSKWKCTCC